jgi:hypothetical protein
MLIDPFFAFSRRTPRTIQLGRQSKTLPSLDFGSRRQRGPSAANVIHHCLLVVHERHRTMFSQPGALCPSPGSLILAKKSPEFAKCGFSRDTVDAGSCLVDTFQIVMRRRAPHWSMKRCPTVTWSQRPINRQVYDLLQCLMFTLAGCTRGYDWGCWHQLN